MAVDLAKIAYNAYGDCREWKVFSGDVMPSWEEQSEPLREAWIAAAVAVAEAVNPSGEDSNAE